MPQRRKTQVDYSLPYNLDFKRACETAGEAYLFLRNKTTRERADVLSGLNVCAEEILSLERNYHVTRDFFPTELLGYLRLTEEDYLHYPLEQLQQAKWDLLGVIAEIKEMRDIETVDVDYILDYVPTPLRETIIRLQNEEVKTITEQLTYDRLHRVYLLVKATPYKDYDGKPRPMEDFVTLATGLKGFDDPDTPLRIHKRATFTPLREEFSINRDFQNLVDTYLQDMYQRSFPFALFNRTFPNTEHNR